MGIFSLPAFGAERVKNASEPKVLGLVGVRVLLRQLSRLDSQKLPEGLNPLGIEHSPVAQAISAKSVFVLSW